MNTIFKIFGVIIFILFLFASYRYVPNISNYVTGQAKIEQKKQADKTLALVKCQQLCQNKIVNNDQDFNVGSCLSESIIPGWVCDIAHSPRQPIDNDPRNQCTAFRDGTAQHFVEVDGNCNVIQVK